MSRLVADTCVIERLVRKLAGAYPHGVLLAATS
jgi:hypothetical protein